MSNSIQNKTDIELQKQEIMKEIIEIIAKNNLTVHESKRLLCDIITVIHKQQPVTISL